MRKFAVLIALLVLLGACTDGGSEDGATTTSSTMPSAPGGGGGGGGGAAGDAYARQDPNNDQQVILPNGRLVRPEGDRFDLGDFPLALAVSPDGRLAVVSNAGRSTGLEGGDGSSCDETGEAAQCDYVKPEQAGDPDTPLRDESLSVVDLRTGKVTDVTAVETVRDPAAQQFNYFSFGVAFSPDGTHLYATGGGNEGVYDFEVRDGALRTPPRILTLPSTIRERPPNGPLEEIIGNVAGYTKGLSVSPDGKELLVVKEFDNDVSVIDTETMELRQQLAIDAPARAWGSYLYGIVHDPDGTRAYVSAQGTGKLHALERAPDGTWSVGSAVEVGDHPTAVSVRPDGSLVAVANANDDTVVLVDPDTMTVVQRQTLKPIAEATWGSVPNALTWAPDGERLYVALAGMDAIAVLDRAGDEFKTTGYVPTGWYPTAVGVVPETGELLAVSAKGLGVRFPDDGTVPAPDLEGKQGIDNTYLPLEAIMPGLLTRVDEPAEADLRRGAETVRANVAHVTADLDRSPNNPVPDKVGDPSPITHVVYVVRENRTFDQVFGDLGATRDDVDADPDFELLADATPNVHAMLEWGAGTGDRFFSNGEASVQGHWWTAGANVSDYTEKGWHQNYSPRGRPYDFVVPTAQTKGCTVFQAAQRRADQTDGAFTFRNYGEPLGYLVGPEIGTEQAVDPCPAADGDTNFGPLLADIQDLSIDDRTRVATMLEDMGLDEDGKQVGDPKTNYLRNFSYVTLPQDHTTGLAGDVTPRAQVAQNDEALAQLVSAISKSKYWESTAVLVVEDDSADGVDHIDGHRNILLVASPFAKHEMPDGTPGYISHQHLDQSSVVRTIGLILGWDPLAAYDQLALPLYDLFQDKNDVGDLTEADLEPFEPVEAPSFIEEPVSAYKAKNARQLKAESAGLNLDGWDRAGPLLESILWRSLRTEQIPAELARRVDEGPGEEGEAEEALEDQRERAIEAIREAEDEARANAGGEGP